jgi:diguanylate cyclase (GGDEF)-like protein
MIDLVNLPSSFVKSQTYFNAQLLIDWGLCSRSHLPLSLFIIEVDEFEHYLELEGVEASNNCIEAVATALNATLRREYDFIAQATTSRFMFLANDMTFKQAGLFAEKCHQAIRAQAISFPGRTHHDVVTISIGHSTCTPDTLTCAGPQNLLKTATRHLNRALKAGGNTSKTSLSFKN